MKFFLVQIFPTGALVMGKSGIHKAYETGKGSIVLRSRTEIEVIQEWPLNGLLLH